jgi:AraC-like DNA-binding protein
MEREWSRYYRRPALHDLDVLHARFIEHRFARHSHEYYVIGIVEAGVQAYSYRGARYVTPAGQIFLVNPGEPHTGEAATREGYVYRTVYPRLALMQQVAAEVTPRTVLPFFAPAVIRDEKLARRLARFHRAVAEGASSLSVESHLIAALAHLIRRYADVRPSRSSGLSERAAIRKAREYIDARYDADVSLADLAALVDLSPFYFARAFQKDVGLPPHAYLETVRITRARDLLLRGVPITDVSVTVGYGDQSHLTHRFKRLLGMTPGQVARNAKDQGVR